MAEALTAHIELTDPPAVILRGDLDRSGTSELDAATSEIIAARPASVVLDFSATGYINSSGIALIVGLLGKARAAGISVHARGLSNHYRRVFEITRLSEFIDINDEGGTDD